MPDEVFADRIGAIAVTGGVVRFDLLALDPSSPDAKGQPSPVVRQRVVMPADGFVGLANAAVHAMARLEKLGLVKKADGSDTAVKRGG